VLQDWYTVFIHTDLCLARPRISNFAALSNLHIILVLALHRKKQSLPVVGCTEYGASVDAQSTKVVMWDTDNVSEAVVSIVLSKYLEKCTMKF
jgi:hypothetical protein